MKQVICLVQDRLSSIEEIEGLIASQGGKLGCQQSDLTRTILPYRKLDKARVLKENQLLQALFSYKSVSKYEQQNFMEQSQLIMCKINR